MRSLPANHKQRIKSAIPTPTLPSHPSLDSPLWIFHHMCSVQFNSCEQFCKNVAAWSLRTCNQPGLKWDTSSTMWPKLCSSQKCYDSNGSMQYDIPSNRFVNVMDDIKHCVEMIAILRTTFNLKRTVLEFVLYKNLVISYLTDAPLPSDLMSSASTSMAIHHKAGSAKITAKIRCFIKQISS